MRCRRRPAARARPGGGGGSGSGWALPRPPAPRSGAASRPSPRLTSPPGGGATPGMRIAEPKGGSPSRSRPACASPRIPRQRRRGREPPRVGGRPRAPLAPPVAPQSRARRCCPAHVSPCPARGRRRAERVAALTARGGEQPCAGGSPLPPSARVPCAASPAPAEGSGGWRAQLPAPPHGPAWRSARALRVSSRRSPLPALPPGAPLRGRDLGSEADASFAPRGGARGGEGAAASCQRPRPPLRSTRGTTAPRERAGGGGQRRGEGMRFSGSAPTAGTRSRGRAERAPAGGAGRWRRQCGAARAERRPARLGGCRPWPGPVSPAGAPRAAAGTGRGWGTQVAEQRGAEGRSPLGRRAGACPRGARAVPLSAVCRAGSAECGRGGSSAARGLRGRSAAGAVGLRCSMIRDLALLAVFCRCLQWALLSARKNC